MGSGFSVSGLERKSNAFAVGTVPAAKYLILHLQVLQVKFNQSPFLCEVKSTEVVGVSLGIEAEFKTELVDELGIDSTLIENWHHERPVIEVQDEVTNETEEELDNSRLQEDQAGI